MSIVFPHRGVAIDWDWQPNCRCDRPSVTGPEPRLAIHALSRHPARAGGGRAGTPLVADRWKKSGPRQRGRHAARAVREGQ